MKQRLILNGALLMACVAALLTPPGAQHMVPVAFDVRSLPDRIEAWQGSAVYFCHRESCLRSFLGTDLETIDTCPACGSDLVQDWSLGERLILPEGSRLARKVYANSAGETVTLTLVFSGRERAAIHRPENCLPGQGRNIVESEVVAVPLPQQAPLEVTMLTTRPVPALERAGVSSTGTFAYWFTSGRRSTPHNLQRLFWTGWDRLVRNRNQEWAYITVATQSGSRPPANRRIIEAFLAAAAPHLPTAD